MVLQTGINDPYNTDWNLKPGKTSDVENFAKIDDQGNQYVIVESSDPATTENIWTDLEYNVSGDVSVMREYTSGSTTVKISTLVYDNNDDLIQVQETIGNV